MGAPSFCTGAVVMLTKEASGGEAPAPPDPSLRLRVTYARDTYKNLVDPRDQQDLSLTPGQIPADGHQPAVMSDIMATFSA